MTHPKKFVYRPTATAGAEDAYKDLVRRPPDLTLLPVHGAFTNPVVGQCDVDLTVVPG